MDSTSAFSIGHATVITALRKSTPQEALACLEEKQQLNASALILYKGERFYWEMAPMMRKLLSARVRLYAKVIGQIKETAEFQETASPPASC